MQARRDAVAGLQGSDDLATVHLRADLGGGDNRLETRQQTARVLERHDRAVDHLSREVHNAVCGGEDPRVGRVDVDSPVARAVLRERCEERPHDAVRGRDGPQPVRGGGGGRRGRSGRRAAARQRQARGHHHGDRCHPAKNVCPMHPPIFVRAVMPHPAVHLICAKPVGARACERMNR